ncbi:hypothetical protein AJ80_06914 [Polytolypa hystricis UAMH7299]|uniref:Phenazine biosynthesis protein n=1 Tax=Polytolypa hystricis (strain UAMH7299) TaxID=1447883 RepID=A0A2B7XSL8_POLH7|nr:hypothetical protein AJ80_06914 [Polytolypa hystricis UAMH7299]
MSSSIPFSIVDVFSTTAYKGNPLAVVNALSTSLSDTQMKLVTRQFNLSETTFVCPPTVSSAAYRLRSFLPNGIEIFGAGHNSLGALWWLAKGGHLDSITSEDGGVTLRFKQQMGQETLPVTIIKPRADNETTSKADRAAAGLSVTLQQAAPLFYEIHSDPRGLAETLGLADESSLGFEIAGKKVALSQVVSTSSSRHLLVPVANEEVLNSITLLDRERLAREIRVADPLAYGLYLFTARHQDDASRLPTFVTRFFSPGMSGEDPATGSAAGPLGAYLLKHGVLNIPLGEKKEVKVLQGLKMGRECLLTVTVGQGKDENSDTSIELSGGGVEVMHGTLVIPASDTVF